MMCASTPRASCRPGMVLVAAVLLLLACAVSFTAATYMAAQAVVIATGRADALRARLAAEGAVRAAAAGRVDDARELPLFGERALPIIELGGGATAAARIRRLGGELYLLIGDGRAGPARARAAAVVRILSIGSLLRAFPAALTLEGGRIGPAAVVTGTGPDTASGAAPSNCPAGVADTVAAVFGTVARPALLVPERTAVDTTGSSLAGAPAIQVGLPDTDTSGLGPISWDRLGSIADRIEAGTVSPSPADAGGTCDRTAPGNWGAPRDATSPCAPFFPLIYAPGDLRVAGGSGQGVLVVRGSLRLEAGARFFGPVFVGGQVLADSSVEVSGALRARSADWKGRASYSACWLVGAIAESSPLSRPFRAGPRFWVPYF